MAASLLLGINGRLAEGETLQAISNQPGVTGLQWQALIGGQWYTVATGTSGYTIPAGAAGISYRFAATHDGQTVYSASTAAAVADRGAMHAPVLSGWGDLITFPIPEHFVIDGLFDRATFSDVDKGHFRGGVLEVFNTSSLAAGGDGHEALFVRFTVANRLSYNEATGEISYMSDRGSAVIGTIAPGTDGVGCDLKIVFTRAATPEAINALIDNLGLAGNDDSPVTERLLTLRVTDPDGGSAQVVHWVAVQPTPDAPMFTSATEMAVDENQQAVGTVAAIDPDVEAGLSQGIAYSLVSGVGDSDYFSVDTATGALRFKTAPNYEDPFHPPQYNAWVLATDGEGSVAQQRVTVTVRDVNDAPVLLQWGNLGYVMEATPTDAGIGGISGDLYAFDADAFDVLSWSGSAVGVYGRFDIAAATGEWTYILDNDRPATEALATGQIVFDSFVATVTDRAGASVQQQVQVAVFGADEAPTSLPPTPVSGIVIIGGTVGYPSAPEAPVYGVY